MISFSFKFQSFLVMCTLKKHVSLYSETLPLLYTTDAKQYVRNTVEI